MKLGKKNISLRIFCLLISMSFLYISIAQETLAAEYSDEKYGLEVMFVVDVSGSMRSNDPNEIALEMVKAFVDTVHTEETSVGFVAYSDTVVSSYSPVSMLEQSDRERLKSQIDAAVYSGNTDIGLGLSEAYDHMSQADGKERIIVLISDGETDLQGSQTGRTEQQSDQDVERVVRNCQAEGIPVYTIAFGEYSGSSAILETIALETGAKTYIAQNPELLIDVLYGILNNNLTYKIQQISAGTYAQGSQEINAVLNEAYLNEVDVLLISPQRIERTELWYGETEIQMTAASYYAVGKITGADVNDKSHDLTIYTDTVTGQQVKVFIIGYRNLMPVMDLETEAERNHNIPYRVFFRDKSGTEIKDETFYLGFNWELLDSSGRELTKETSITPEGIQGILRYDASGNYNVQGSLSDKLGAYQFIARLNVNNIPPQGSLPAQEYHRFSGKKILSLDEYFIDPDGDILSYALVEEHGKAASIILNGSEMVIEPQKAGIQEFVLKITDGEDILLYAGSIQIKPLWQVYWPVIVFIAFAIVLILWKLLYKPKTLEEQFADIKTRSRFSGKLNLYFTSLPDEVGEIPPLVFLLHKLRDSKLCLGDLLQNYPEEVKKLGLDRVYLVAAENRRMIIYHDCESTIMIGNAIVCRRLHHTINFGDVIYVTSSDGSYDMELHYISLI